MVVPALNEARTIASVVRFALKDPEVAEVIVIDDGSVDGTPELAREAGARVVTSSLLGKGASMEEGVEAARHEYIVYLDGENDRCMLEAAGQSVAFRPKSDEVGESARRIAMKDLLEVLEAVR